MFKRGFHGTYHTMTTKHLEHYASEFAGRHNIRSLDTPDQIASMVRGMDGRRLTYKELIAAEKA